MSNRAPGGKYRRYVFFVVASLALFMWSVDSTIVATALATIQRDMKANLSWTGWVITAYQLTAMTVMPLVGRISDEWGRRRVFMGCVTIFTAGSLFCALAPNICCLIAARFLQALGGGGFMPSAVGIVGDHFAEERPRFIVPADGRRDWHLRRGPGPFPLSGPGGGFPRGLLGHGHRAGSGHTAHPGSAGRPAGGRNGGVKQPEASILWGERDRTNKEVRA